MFERGGLGPVPYWVARWVLLSISAVCPLLLVVVVVDAATYANTAHNHLNKMGECFQAGQVKATL